MNKFKYLNILLIFFFSFAFFSLSYINTSGTAEAAQKSVTSKESSVKAAKSIAKKSSKIKAKKTVAKSAKISGKKSAKLAVDKAKSQTVKSADKDKNKELWIKRASESQFFTGKASWYGRDFHNKATASGLTYDMHTFTAAHRTLPMGTVVKVTDQNNGKSVMVCITDRGPYVAGRIIDLSYAAAKKIGLNNKGVSKVKLEVVSDEHGQPLKSNQSYYVRYGLKNGVNHLGPYDGFADAMAMQEAISQAHPDAEVVIDKTINQ